MFNSEIYVKNNDLIHCTNIWKIKIEDHIHLANEISAGPVFTDQILATFQGSQGEKCTQHPNRTRTNAIITSF